MNDVVGSGCEHGYARLEELIPHAADMCLLDRIDSVSEARIRCYSRSQTLPDNPLRFKGRLSALSGIEYAAQAMAAHGALNQNPSEANALSQTAIKRGYISALSQLECFADYLDQYDLLCIECEQTLASAQGSQYVFSVRAVDAETDAAGGTLLLQGKALVIIEAEQAQATS